MKNKRFLILTLVFCVIIFMTFIILRNTLFAQQGATPQNVRNVQASNDSILDSTQDPSINNDDVSSICDLDINGKTQSFLITAHYGPNPCTPIGEGGNAYWAISISPRSTFERYAYLPKNLSYNIEFLDFKENILKHVMGTSIVEYKKTGSGNSKKVVGWIYGFYKPETLKDKIGARSLIMAYQVGFINNDSANILQFDLASGKTTPAALAKKTNKKTNYSVWTKKKHMLIAARQGGAVSGGAQSDIGISIAPGRDPIYTGAGISPIAGGGVSLGSIDMITGGLVKYFVDMALPGGLAIIRHYNSAMGYQPGRSFGWMFNFEESLRFDPDGSVFYRDISFKEYRFIENSDNKYHINYVPSNPGNSYVTAKPGILMSLSKNSEGNYEVEFKDQSKKVFNSLGLLIKTADSKGNTTNYVWELPVNQIRENYDMPARLMAVIGMPDIFRANRALTITDPYNRSVYVYFNDFGRVAKITDWAGKYVEYSWDGKKGVYLTGFKDLNGNYTSFSYETGDSNRLFSINYPNGAMVKNYYLSALAPNSQAVNYQEYSTGSGVRYNYGWLRDPQENWTEINDNGKVSTYYYDKNGSITKVTTPGPNNSQATTVFTYYTDKNLLKSVTDPLGRTLSYDYDGQGNITQIKLPDGKIIKCAYNSNTNKLTDIWDTKGRRMSYKYNGNNLTSAENPDNTGMQFEYDNKGRIIKSTDPNGNSVNFEYGIHGDITKITDDEGGAALFYRDSLGRVVITDVNGSRNQVAYDNLGNITQFTDALGNSTNISYDGNGNAVSVVDANGDTQSFEYNVMGNLTRTTGPSGESQSYRYDYAGNIAGITDPNGKNIGFEYNYPDYLSIVTDQNYKRSYYTYDAVGNMISASNPVAGKMTEFQYNDMNFLSQKTAAGENTARYEYDEAGNLKRITDNSGETLYEYDSMDRMTKKIYPDKSEIEFKYDKSGRVISEKQINGDEFQYEYDKAGRLISSTKGRDILICKYNQNQDLASIEYPNKVRKFISYDPNKNIARIKYISSQTGEVIREINYEYNKLGKITKEKTSGYKQSEKIISYEYDKAGRLKEVKLNNTAIAEYTYDLNGNRLTSRTPKGAMTYWYNDANELLKTTKTSYTYDNAGNIISENSDAGKRTYEYDKENNLILIKENLANKKESTISYNYSADNLRIGKVSSVTKEKTSAYWLGGELLGEADSRGKFKFVNYGYGFKNQKGERCYYITDAQGSVIGLTDEDGKLITSYEYDKFGNPIGTVNVFAPQSAPAGGNKPKPNVFVTFINFIKNLFGIAKDKKTDQTVPVLAVNKVESPIRYAGYYYDKDTGLYYTQSRYYDPEIGRFTQADKISYDGGWNLYTYCRNDPVNYTDPWGTEGKKYIDIHLPLKEKAERLAAQEVAEAEAALARQAKLMPARLGSSGNFSQMVYNFAQKLNPGAKAVLITGGALLLANQMAQPGSAAENPKPSAAQIAEANAKYNAQIKYRDLIKKLKNETLEDTRNRVSKRHPEYKNYADLCDDPEMRLKLKMCSGETYPALENYVYAGVAGGAFGVGAEVISCAGSGDGDGASQDSPTAAPEGSKPGTVASGGRNTGLGSGWEKVGGTYTQTFPVTIIWSLKIVTEGLDGFQEEGKSWLKHPYYYACTIKPALIWKEYPGAKKYSVVIKKDGKFVDSFYIAAEDAAYATGYFKGADLDSRASIKEFKKVDYFNMGVSVGTVDTNNESREDINRAISGYTNYYLNRRGCGGDVTVTVKDTDIDTSAAASGAGASIGGGGAAPKVTYPPTTKRGPQGNTDTCPDCRGDRSQDFLKIFTGQWCNNPFHNYEEPVSRPAGSPAR